MAEREGIEVNAGRERMGKEAEEDAERQKIISVYTRVCQLKAVREYPFFQQLYSRFAI